MFLLVLQRYEIIRRKKVPVVKVYVLIVLCLMEYYALIPLNIIFVGKKEAMKDNGLLWLGLEQLLGRSDLEPVNINRFINSEIALVHTVGGLSGLKGKVVLERKPYRLTEGRVMVMRSGSVKVKLNLKEYEFRAGQVVVVSPGVVFELQSYPEDDMCNFTMIAFANSFMENWQKDNYLTAYMQGRVCEAISDEELCRRTLALTELMWGVLHDKNYSKRTVQSLLGVVFCQIDYFRQRQEERSPACVSRQEEVLERFIALVNEHACRERSVGFYADRLCMTPRYLGAVIRASSGKTVMEWVNEAVMQEAKLMLCCTNKLIFQISDELNFPNASFFCKFFRRMEGISPREYKKRYGMN